MRWMAACGLAGAIAAAGPAYPAPDVASAVTSPSRPNLLWLSCEDTSPWFGFCGVDYARTPNLDALARRGVYYRNAFATAPVCSPCRYSIITGTHATSYGTQHLRSRFDVPDSVAAFPAQLRKAGYYCTNRSKTDYNTADEPRLIREAWDECSGKAHWRNRKPGQPFFAVFNLTETHQGQVFESTPPKLEPSERHDPARAPLPPYYPDTTVARRTMARVHDCITAMDRQAGAILDELDRAGLADDTIVFFWPDHGQGIPRGKRTLWDTGLRIPLVVHVPEKYRHLAAAEPGGVSDRLVYLMDLGPTLLSLLGLPIPPHMHGRAFLGPAAAAPRDYVVGARDRVDEAVEFSRSVRDTRHLYIRNFMPDLSWNQSEFYSDQLELRREIAALAAAGSLGEGPLTYAAPNKPAEALYDTESDPWQMKNLAADPAHAPVLERMRKTLRDWQIETRDLGFLPEWRAVRLEKETGRPLVEAARDEARYPLSRVMDTAWRVGRPGEEGEFVRRLADADPTVRYWAVVGLRSAGPLSGGSLAALKRAVDDEAWPVRIEAAGILAGMSGDAKALERLADGLSGEPDAALHAARTLQRLGPKALPVLPTMRAALETSGKIEKPFDMYIGACLRNAVNAIGGTKKPRNARQDER